MRIKIEYELYINMYLFKNHILNKYLHINILVNIYYNPYDFVFIEKYLKIKP